MFKGSKQELKKLMTIVLSAYGDEKQIEKLCDKYGSSNVYEAYAKCIDNKYFNGRISYVRTLADEIFITTTSTISLSLHGQHFVANNVGCLED